jgi:hypothetical protein
MMESEWTLMPHEKHRIVVSAQNGGYQAWQCKLFHFSCRTRCQQTPLILVHETGRPLHRDFIDIRRDGGDVRIVPDYSLTSRGERYPPRNFPGAVLCAAKEEGRNCDYFVFCDPDMIFVRRPCFLESMAGDRCEYLNFDQPKVRQAIERMRLDPEAVLAKASDYSVMVPYVVPAKQAQKLASNWIRATDAFASPAWEDMMYGFGLASFYLDSKVQTSQIVQHNFFPDAPLTGEIIHYCYVTPKWNKRTYLDEERVPLVWEHAAEAAPGSVLEEILRQLREAKSLYQKIGLE